MTDQKGEPVGLRMGLQAGALIGLYLGFSLATISVLTDAEEVKEGFVSVSALDYSLNSKNFIDNLSKIFNE